MKDNIKSYWHDLIEEYKDVIFNDYEESKPLLEKFRKYLENLLNEYPNSVDVICALANTLQELGFEIKPIKLLEDFLEKYSKEIDDKDKARIYTNIAFYYNEYDEIDKRNKIIEYLLKAEKVNSKFLETYIGLAQYYFSWYEYEENFIYLENCLESLKKALEINSCYEVKIGYAICLFEMKKFKEAKEIFEELLQDYPNRVRLLLNIAYCEAYLGDKERAIYYLKQIKYDGDKNYNLIIDDVMKFEIYDAYYMLEEYNLYLNEFEKIELEYPFTYNDCYYYAFWITKQYDKFYKKIIDHKKGILNIIKETKLDESYSNEEKASRIKYYKEDLKELAEIENKIKNKNYKPTVELKLYFEYRCYLIDCIRDGFIS